MRLSEVTHGRWDEIDLDTGIWKVPAARSKSKKAMVKYLNDIAKHVLLQVGARGKSESVFPNPMTGKPYTTITRVFYRLRRLANIPSSTRLHDLRHTYASLLVNAGRLLYEVQMLLNHQNSITTMKSRIYPLKRSVSQQTWRQSSCRECNRKHYRQCQRKQLHRNLWLVRNRSSKLGQLRSSNSRRRHSRCKKESPADCSGASLRVFVLVTARWVT